MNNFGEEGAAISNSGALRGKVMRDDALFAASHEQGTFTTFNSVVKQPYACSNGTTSQIVNEEPHDRMMGTFSSS